MRLGFQLSKLTFDSVRCGMWYQRIMETRDEGIFDSCHDLVANPIEMPSTRQPLKRRRREDVEVDDDPAHFRRVRLKCRSSPPPLPPARVVHNSCSISWRGLLNKPSNLDLSPWSSPNNGSEGQSEPFQHRSTSLSPQLGHAKKEPMQKRRGHLTANGREHAKKVRRVLVCFNCRQKHTKCIHISEALTPRSINHTNTSFELLSDGGHVYPFTGPPLTLAAIQEHYPELISRSHNELKPSLSYEIGHENIPYTRATPHSVTGNTGYGRRSNDDLPLIRDYMGPIENASTSVPQDTG